MTMLGVRADVPEQSDLALARRVVAGDLNAFESIMRRHNRMHDRFFTAPTKVVPGTSMGYAGIDARRERADLIAYLKAENGSRAQCPRAHGDVLLRCMPGLSTPTDLRWSTSA